MKYLMIVLILVSSGVTQPGGTAFKEERIVQEHLKTIGKILSNVRDTYNETDIAITNSHMIQMFKSLTTISAIVDFKQLGSDPYSVKWKKVFCKDLIRTISFTNASLKKATSINLKENIKAVEYYYSFKIQSEYCPLDAKKG